MSEQTPPKKTRLNLRSPDVMSRVEAEVKKHYRSNLIDHLRSNKGKITIENTTIFLAKQFGFCYGVERAIDLAYAARDVFKKNDIYLIGEIIHNQEVNKQLQSMQVVSLPWQKLTADYDRLTPEDVVIVPAFGAPLSFIDKLKAKGVQIVDTTCGDVMKVWRRVRDYAKNDITAIIHGKAGHEETLATASRARNKEKLGEYLVVLNMKEAELVADYIKGKGDRQQFLKYFADAHSANFDPDKHLQKIGIANQTTMLKSETESIGNFLKQAIINRDGNEDNFSAFDTICGATQDRQQALFSLLEEPLDMLVVVGGYNSSNTSHLVEIGSETTPTFFINSAECLQSVEKIIHFDLHQNKERQEDYTIISDLKKPITIGVTAGASCPNNLIEEVIEKLMNMRGIDSEKLLQLTT